MSEDPVAERDAHVESPTLDSLPNQLVQGVTERLARWAQLAREGRTTTKSTKSTNSTKWRSESELLRGIHDDADAFDFVRAIFDTITLPRDAFVTAFGLRELSHQTPESLPQKLKIALRVGGIASIGMPWGIVPIVKQRFRSHLRDLIVCASLPNATKSATQLREALRSTESEHVTTDVELLGSAVHGGDAATREAERLSFIAALPEVTNLTLDLGRLVPSLTEWSTDSLIDDPPTELRTVFDACLAHDVIPTIAVRRYFEAAPATKLLMRLLDDPAYTKLTAGVEVLSELPESLDILDPLVDAARQRVARGGAPVAVRLIRGSLVRNETIASIERGISVATLVEKTQVDANFVRLVDRALHDENARALRPTVTTEDPTLAAFTLDLAARRGVSDHLTIGLRRGIAPDLASALSAGGARVHVLTPVVRPKELEGAYDAVLTVLSDVIEDASAFDLNAELFHNDAGRAALMRETQASRLEELLMAVRDEPAPTSHRVQDRRREWDPSERDSALFYRPPASSSRFDTGGLTAAVLGLTRMDTGEIKLVQAGAEKSVPVVSASGFACEPDTDATRAVNRDWVRGLLARARGDIGMSAVAESVCDSIESFEHAVQEARAAGESWAAGSHQTRATRLRRAALATVAARDRLTEVLATERGLPIHEIDAEIGAAVDATRYHASNTEGLRTVRGATFNPRSLTLVAADEVTPLGELAEALAAALGAGSGVVLAAHRATARTAAVLVEEWEAAGIPPKTIRLMVAAKYERALAVGPAPGVGPEPAIESAAEPRSFDELALSLVERPEFDQAMFFTSQHLIARAKRRKPALPLDGRARGLGTALWGVSAEHSTAIPALVKSAFVAAGTHPRTARAVIVLSHASRPKQFFAALADAVNSLRVGDTGDPGDVDPLTFDVGPLPTAPDEAGIRALTLLEPGEEWLVKPARLRDDGRLWRPGVRIGVKPDSAFWAAAQSVSVIGVARAHSLTEAVNLQNELGGGAVAALFSLDADEILPWLDAADAAALVVNRKSTAAKIERHPSGVWRGTQSSPQPLAGGPNRLLTLGHWTLRVGTRSETLHLRGLDPLIRTLIETVQPSLDYERFDLVRRAALADALAWRTQFGLVRDTPNLGIEQNVLRYKPVPVHIRFAENADLADLVRVLAAGHLARAPLTVSTGQLLPVELSELLGHESIRVTLERDDDWLPRAAVLGAAVSGDGEQPAARIRLISDDRLRVTEWLSSKPEVAVWADPVTMAGAVELFGFLREQAISVAACRNGFAAPITEVVEWFESL